MSERQMKINTGVLASILKELRELFAITLYFLSCFVIFLTLKKLLLEEYNIQINILAAAIIGALIIAKVVLIGEKTNLGNRFARKTLLFHIIWRSLVYTTVVFFVTLAEHLFVCYRKVGNISQAVSELWVHHNIYHFFAMNIAVAISFLIYNFYRKIDSSIGKGALIKLLFSSPNNESFPR